MSERNELNSFYSPLVTLHVDMNMLRGRRIRTALDFRADGGKAPATVVVGQTIRVVTEDGDAYLAVVDELRERGTVALSILPYSFQPAVEERTE